jgi:hypothetical protein
LLSLRFASSCKTEQPGKLDLIELMNDIPGDSLWWIANVLVSFLAIMIAFHDGMIAAIITWVILTLLLMLFRPT